VSYIGSPIIDSVLFDVELVSNLIDKMDNGKAAGLVRAFKILSSY